MTIKTQGSVSSINNRLSDTEGTQHSRTTLQGRWTVVLILGVALASSYSPVFAQSYQQVAVGESHVCALDAAGQVDCNSTFEAQRYLPSSDLPLMRDISAGQQHTCGVTFDDTVTCWGNSSFGALQIPEMTDPVASISVGTNHTCAVHFNNEVTCWGLNTNGQLNVPVIDGGFVEIDAGRVSTCGIDTLGQAHCWSSDVFLQTAEPVQGPFIDVEAGVNHSCGLTIEGNIECWALRETFNITPPDSGPYTDLTVSNLAICGLGADQFLDCTFAEPLRFRSNDNRDDYPFDVAFTSIELGAASFVGVPVCGIRADDGTIDCFGGTGREGSRLPAPPGIDAVVTSVSASNISLSLVASVYDVNRLELFWNRVPSVIPSLSVEVYRDDELLAITQNGSSYYDDSFQNVDSTSGDTVVYRVRALDVAGDVGDFSNEVVINRVTGEISLDDGAQNVNNPRPDSGVRVRIINAQVIAAGASQGFYTLDWEVENTTEMPLAGFEVRLNNEPVGFTSQTSFFGGQLDRTECAVFSVAAISEDGTVLDYGSTAISFITAGCSGLTF